MKETLVNLSLLSKHWRSVTQSDHLWHLFYLHDIQPIDVPASDENLSGGWKNRCMSAVNDLEVPKLHAAVRKGLVRLARSYLSKETDPKSTLFNLRSQILESETRMLSSTTAFKCLMALGAPYQPTADRFGHWLHYTASSTNVPFLEYLLKEYYPIAKTTTKPQYDINIPAASDGFTALHCLFEDNAGEGVVKDAEVLRPIAQMLLAHGADPTRRNRDGQDVFEFASIRGYPKEQWM
mgnify:FL=1